MAKCKKKKGGCKLWCGVDVDADCDAGPGELPDDAKEDTDE